MAIVNLLPVVFRASAHRVITEFAEAILEGGPPKQP